MSSDREQPTLTVTPLIIFVVGVAILNGNLGVYVVPFQIGAWMDGIHYSASQSGLLGTIEIAAMSVTAIVVAPLMLRRSPASVAKVGATIAIAAQLVTASIDQYAILAIARGVVGLGSGLVFASVVAAVAVTRDPDRLMGLGLAVMNLLFMVVFVLIPYALLWHLHRGLFVGLAVLMIVSIPAYRLLPDRVAAEEHSGVRTPPTGVGFHVVVHFTAIVLLNVGLGALWGFVERVGVQIGLTVETIGTILSASTLAMIIGSLFAGWLGVRVGRAIPMLVASVLCGASAFGVMTADTLMVYAASVMLYGAAYLFLGPYIIVGMSSALDRSGRLAPACGGAMFLAYSVGVGGGGIIADTISFSAIGWIASVACVASGLLFFGNALALEARHSDI
jgi:MFS family permease